MRIRAYLRVVTTLIATLGIVGTVGAAPDDSQRLRGLGDRVFLVTVELKEDPFEIFLDIFGVPVGTTFPNCYIFAAEADTDGNNWFETAFPGTVGTWSQGSVGAKTGYVVNAGDLVQFGQVTPAGGKGVLQLDAESSIPGVLLFFSVGAEIEASKAEIDAREIPGCPTFPIFTLPDTS